MSGASPATAGSYDVNTGLGLTLDGTPLALRGYDAVSYFDGGPKPGSAEQAVAHAGATYRFSSRSQPGEVPGEPGALPAAVRRLLRVRVSVGAKFDCDPLVWEIVGDRLYLNLNAAVQKNWTQARMSRIALADDRWAEIRDADPRSLRVR